MWGSNRIGSSRSFLAVFFVLTITFCLISAGIFKANISIGMAAYAAKLEQSSGVDKSGEGGGSNNGGHSSSSGSDGGGGGNSDEGSGGSNDNGGGNIGSSGGVTGGDNNLVGEEPNPPNPPIEEPPRPATCEQGSTSPECSNVPEPPTPPPPPGPIDCSTTPDDPSCKTTPGPVDCNTNPNDPSCGPQPPVDCKANPDYPSCTQPPTVDCSTTPDDALCKPACKINERQLSNGNCVPICDLPLNGRDCTPTPPPKCKSDERLVDGKCEKKPDDSCALNPDQSKCKADCDENNFCQCPNGFVMNEDDNCRPDKPCPKGFEQHDDDETGRCFPIKCPPGYHLENGVCTRTIIRHVTTVETIVRNFVTSNQPSFLLLLDTAQLCQLAGDTQCVAKQNQFNTLNIVTKLDSATKTWTITGQVENRVLRTQNNVQVLGYFYDSKGNNVGGPYKGMINPTVLKSHQLGAFSMKPSMSIMKGTPSFIRLECQSLP